SLLLTVTVIALGSSFQFGYQTGVVNEALVLIGNYTASVALNRTGQPMSDTTIETLKSVVVAIFPVGGMVGGVSAGYLARRLGRKGSLLLNNVPMMLGSGLMLLCAWVASYELLIVGRLFAGLSAGVSTGVAPLYLSEVAPQSLKGASGTLNQLAIVIAILVSQLLGLDFVLGTPDRWFYLMSLTLLPSCLQLLVLPFCPESPRHLLLDKSDSRLARSALVQLRGESSEVDEELSELAREADPPPEPMSLRKLLCTPHLRYLLLVACAMQLSQQLSGINAVINYSTEIFLSANMTQKTATYATIGIGCVNVLVTFVSAAIVDKAGRRTLHMCGLAGMCLSAGALTVSLVLHHNFQPVVYSCVAFIYIYVVFFAIGPGAIPWFIVAEMFNQAARPVAVSVAVLVNWAGQILIGMGYPPVLAQLKDYSFLPFVFLLLVFFLFTWFFVPETKGRTPEDVEMVARERTGTVQYESINPDLDTD
ncbi:hypothetical protein BOX15_Mlig028790g4, partial [Macrostomum lignano]